MDILRVEMSKVMKQFRLQQEIVNVLEELAGNTGKTQTQIVEEAIKLLYSNENKIKDEIELYKKENEQLKMVIKVFQEREKAIEKVENAFRQLLEQKDLLIKEKDERIKELQERLKERVKAFWKFW